MNTLGKFLESKAGTWCIVILGTALAPLPFFGQTAGIVAAVALSYVGLIIPQITLYRNAQLAKTLQGEPEDD